MTAKLIVEKMRERLSVVTRKLGFEKGNRLNMFAMK